MPEVKALKTFDSRYGKVRAGERFSAEQGYAVELLRNGLIKIVKEDENEPERIQAFTGAPSIKNAPDPQPTSAGQRVAGVEQPSLSSRPVLASQVKTPPPSKPAGNAKRS